MCYKISTGCIMGEATFTFRVDGKLKDKFAKAAKRSDHNAAQMLRQFMRDFVREQERIEAEEAWIDREMDQALKQADATPEADWIPHEWALQEMARERARLVQRIAARRQ